MPNMNRTKHCIISQVYRGRDVVWVINLSIEGFLQSDEFAFGLRLGYEFETQKKAYDFAKNNIDSYIEEGLKERSE